MSTFTKGADVEAMSRIAANIRAIQTELATIEFWVFSPEAFDFWVDDLSFAP